MYAHNTLFSSLYIGNRNFDAEFTSENPTSSVINESNLSSTVQKQFEGFTYNGNEERVMNSVAQSSFGASP